MSHVPRSWTNTVSLFRPQKSLTCLVNRHTSLIRSLPPLLCPPFCLPGTLTHMPTCTRTEQHTKAQTSPSEIFNHATQLALPLPSIVILYLPVCVPGCSFSSSVVFAVLPSFSCFCSSVQLFPRSPIQPLTRAYQAHLLLISLLFPVFCSL